MNYEWSNKPDNKRKYKVVLVVVLVAVITPLLFVIVFRGETLYARNLELEGEVASIDWVSSNHQLPRIVFRTTSGKEVTVSHQSVSLYEGDIKVGDVLVKESGSNYCLINGREVQFSRYLGEGTLSQILSYMYSK